MNECKHCKGEIGNLSIESTVKYIECENGYIFVGLEHSSNKSEFQPSIRFESCVDGKVCRTKIEINYCPMCGRRL